LTKTLLALLAMPETRSNEDVVRRYDHEVQGGTVVKPFVGFANIGPSDATVLAPLDALRRTALHNRRTTAGESTPSHPPTNLPLSQSTTPTRGVALSVGANPHYSAIDPYLMAWAAVDEAMRNVVAVGADPDQVSLLDNFSWGNPNLPDRLGGLVRCTQGCYNAAVAFGAPFISGKDSLNNEYTGEDGKKHAIPGTLVISALAMVPDVRRTVTMDLKAAGNLLYLVGLTRGEMGGSSYVRMMRSAGNPLPSPPPTRGRESERSGPLPLVGRGLGRGFPADRIILT
jgi:phosphoribosylformylglycinamidine synthase